MIIAILLFALVALTLFLIAPSWHSHSRARLWRGTPFAHRGLHGGDAKENTLPAFARACEAGIGIELDVQLSKDGEVVVFHDDDLKRMTGDSRRVDEVTLAELRRFPLGIPTFEEALTLIDDGGVAYMPGGKGANAAIALKNRLQNDYKVVDLPPPQGKDFNDFLCLQLNMHKHKNKERNDER